MPQLVLAERREKRGTYIVIDGKQRILSLAQFAGQGITGATEYRLRGLTSRVDLNKRSYYDLENLPELADDFAALENSTIRTVVIRGWPDEDFLYLVFLRLNTGSVPLSPQELRQALHPGPFVDFTDEYSFNSTSLRRALGLTGPDFRMRDVELAVRYFGFSYFLSDYAGDLKRFLDTTCFKLNQLWKQDQEGIRARADQLDAAIDTTFKIFGADAFRRYSGAGRYERRFNRAVFDLMVFNFSNAKVARDALTHRAEVKEVFESLSLRDEGFANATQATTKSLQSTFTRLSAWTTDLSSILDAKPDRVMLENGRIRRQVR